MATETNETAEATPTATPTARRAGGRKKSAARARKTTRKSTARKSAGRKSTARKRTAAASTGRRTGRAGGGSPRLADSLVNLLTDVGAEVETVSALSAAIDEAARGLQAQLTEFADRVATLSRLRASVSGGTLAAFLDETLVPQRPTELELLTDRIRNAQNATI